jgi:hypothetical protein
MKINHKKVIVFLALIEILSFSLILPVNSQENVPLQVNRVVWGQSLNAPVKVYPGDEGVSLIVEIQNLSPNSSIRGISGVLTLESNSFTDIYGNPTATAIGTPTIVNPLSPSDQVAAMGFFTMIFHLNVKDSALSGTYQLELKVDYSMVQLLNYTQGVTYSLSVPCTISNASSTIKLSASPY